MGQLNWFLLTSRDDTNDSDTNTATTTTYADLNANANTNANAIANAMAWVNWQRAYLLDTCTWHQA